MLNDKIHSNENFVFVLSDAKTGRVKQHFTWENLVTDEGDQYYAELIEVGFKGTGSATQSFNTLELGTAGNTPTKSSNRSDMTTKVTSSQKAVSSGYPTTSDTDTVNTGSGADVLTWKFEYSTSEANDTSIDRAIITNTSPGASEAVLNYGDSFTGGSFDKTANDTLVVYVNHTINGV